MRTEWRTRLKRWLSWLVCLSMVLNSGAITAFAQGTDDISNVTEKESTVAVRETEPSTEKQEMPVTEAETFVPDTSVPETKDTLAPQPVVYWNASDTLMENGDILAKGSDEKSGQTPEESVETLERAITAAAQLKEQLGQDVTIYAMGTQAVTGDSSKTYDGNGMRIELWGERKSDNNQIFRIESGDLILRNIVLAGREKKPVIEVRNGCLHLGANVEVHQDILMEPDSQEGQNLSIMLEEDFDGLQAYSLFVMTDKEQTNYPLVARGNNKSEDEKIQNVFQLNETLSSLYQISWDGISFLLNTVKEPETETEKDTQEQTEKESIKSTEKETAPSTESETVKKAEKKGRLAKSSTTVYWNPTKTPHQNTDGTILIAAGNDTHDGSRAAIPVLTWKRAKELAGTGGTIIYMSNINIGDTDAADGGLPGIDVVLDGEGATLKQWDAVPEEAFLISDGEASAKQKRSLTLKNIKIEAALDYSNDTIVRIKGGTLNIGENVTIVGEIQTELNDFDTTGTSPIIFTTALKPAEKYQVYFSGINKTMVNQCVNVGKPDPTWNGLLDHMVLSEKNTAAGWTLRYQVRTGTDPKDDLDEDKNVVELYRVYRYSAIYLNGVSGKDENFGGDCSAPVKTFQRAKELLKSEMNGSGTIRICDTVSVAGSAEVWELPVQEFPEAKVELCTTLNSNPVDGHKNIARRLVEVKDGGELTLRDITMVYNNNDVSSVVNAINTVYVAGGGTLNVEDGALLTGLDGVNYTSGNAIYAEGTEAKRAAVNFEGGIIEK